jgi:NDP-sugar pyrophosphorylase family protein
MDDMHPKTRAAIIAAGRGERFRAAGVRTPKPLIEVAGVSLIDRTFDALAAAGIGEAVCLFNAEDDAVERHCRRRGAPPRLEIVRRSTPSSMESLFALAPLFAGEHRLLLLTVDAVFSPATLRDFLATAESCVDADVVLALSSFVDDEKPLFVEIEETGRVIALGAGAAGSGLVTAGFYILHPRIFAEIDAARRAGLASLRQWFAHLIERGYRFHGVPAGKTIDVDRPEDVAAAEHFVRSGFRE